MTLLLHRVVVYRHRTPAHNSIIMFVVLSYASVLLQVVLFLLIKAYAAWGQANQACFFNTPFGLSQWYTKKLRTDSDETWWTGWVCDKEELFPFWWRTESGSGYKNYFNFQVIFRGSLLIYCAFFPLPLFLSVVISPSGFPSYGVEIVSNLFTPCVLLPPILLPFFLCIFNGKCFSVVRGFVIVVSQVHWMSFADIDTRSSVHTEAFGHFLIPKEAPKSSVKL